MNNKKIKRFNFAKRPHKPSFLMWVAKKVLSFPDLKNRDFTLTKSGMEDLEGKPYLMLVTHSSMVDFNVMLKATHPYPVNNVMTLEGFNTYSEPLMRSLGVLGKRKFVLDLSLIKNIKYCLEKLKTIFVLFPEARYSLDGCTSFLTPSLGKLVKMLKVPVVTLSIHGNFVTCPQWNKIDKKSKVVALQKQIIIQKEIETLSVEEVNKRIQESFVYDDYKWQVDNKVIIDHPDRAKGLHNLLYKCSHCGTEFEMNSAGTDLWCDHCHKTWHMNELGELHATSGETEYSHIPDWSNWERSCVRKEIREGTYHFEDEVRIETLPNAKNFYPQGMGKLVQTQEGTRIECNYYDQPHVLNLDGLSLESLHIEYDYLGHGDCVDISIPSDSFWCYLNKRTQITKLSFATEEIHFLAKENSKK